MSDVDPRTWFLTKEERGNPCTRLDDVHPGEQAWSEGNLVRPLIHGVTYFAELCDRLTRTRAGDLVLFTDWQGDYDERLTGESGSEVGVVLCRIDERGVDVRGLVWRSHSRRIGFSSEENRTLGEELQERGVEALLDMRIRAGGSHHQKMVVVRHRDDPAHDVAYVGGIDLCHSRRDDAAHDGDPQASPLAVEYGATPPWHDMQAALEGPAVYDVETVFRERWEDPTPLSRSPVRWIKDRVAGLDLNPDPLPEQSPPPAPVEGGAHAVQLLRTYPDLLLGRDYPFANGGERSVARGYTKALTRARRLVYVEDQYLWGGHIGSLFSEALRTHPGLHVIAVVPLHPDQDNRVTRHAQFTGRHRAMAQMIAAAPDRVAVYGIENHAGTPVYVHAKCCIIDDTWTSIGSDNFNRRSWTHDSELTAVVLDQGPDPQAYGRNLRLALAAEHLDREVDGSPPSTESLGNCVDPKGMFRAFEEAAADLDAWHAGGRMGPRPPGRLRRLRPSPLGPVARAIALPVYVAVHDPDGRPRALRRTGEF